MVHCRGIEINHQASLQHIYFSDVFFIFQLSTLTPIDTFWYLCINDPNSTRKRLYHAGGARLSEDKREYHEASFEAWYHPRK